MILLRSFDWKSILSISAVITSCCALWVSSRQLKIASEEQQASVFPYLTAAYNASTTHLSMYLNNDGLGPAFISGVEIRHRDTVYSDFWQPVAKFLDENKYSRNHHPDSLIFVKSDLLPGWVVRPGGEPYKIFELKNLTTTQLEQFYRFYSDEKEGIKAKIWYLDVYNNCWLFDFNETTVTRCDKCPRQVLHR